MCIHHNDIVMCTGPPVVKAELSIAWTVVGGAFALSCSSSSPELGWYRGTEEVKELTGHTVLCDGQTLLVEGVDKPEVLEYTCLAASPLGNNSAHIMVIITSESATLTFTFAHFVL